MKKLVGLFVVLMLLISVGHLFAGGEQEEAVETAEIKNVTEFGDYDGITVRAKLIGGAQYELLYERIPEWEEETGATVEIISKKNHFDLDKEIKQDIAAGTVDWDVGSNHSSFAPQYGDLYIDLSKYVAPEIIDEFMARALDNCTVDDRLVQMPRHGDVSNLYYQKHLYESEENKREFKQEYGYELKPPETFSQMKDQAIFFADPPNFYGTQYAGKEEALTGRYYEMLVANGGQLFDDEWKPAFNSEEGILTLNWFIDLYEANAVPKGTLNYLWDDLGMGFASGTIALNIDWAGWAAFFNDPEQSKVAGDVGITRIPKGKSGKRGGWSGWHSFSVTDNSKNKAAAISFILFLTNHDSQMVEIKKGLLPSRKQVWDDAKEYYRAQGQDIMVRVYEVWGKTLAEDAFTPPLIPEWIPFSNILYPELQSAIVGDKTAEEALNDAAEATEQLMRESGYY
jgi:multiple sugar transport system substrate-binding protein